MGPTGLGGRPANGWSPHEPVDAPSIHRCTGARNAQLPILETVLLVTFASLELRRSTLLERIWKRSFQKLPGHGCI